MPIFILLWSSAHASPDFLPTWAGSSIVDEAANTAAIAAIFSLLISAMLSTHNGMFPCFLAGRNSSLSNNIPRALHNFSLVWLGSITSSR